MTWTVPLWFALVTVVCQLKQHTKTIVSANISVLLEMHTMVLQFRQHVKFSFGILGVMSELNVHLMLPTW